jgi:TRAP-type C4-dicarboxylate transport system substrate-binding protein
MDALSVSRKWLLALFTVLLCGAIVVVMAAYRTSAHAQTGVIQVRWLISHQPTDVFKNATRVFAQELAKDSNGTMSLQVVTPEDVGVMHGDIPNSQVFQLLDSGNVQLATAYTVALGQQDPAIWSLNLPFAFDSYDQLPAFLDGPTGMQLLGTLASTTGARGLAFTMSGGFRIIASKDKSITSPADLKGLRIATSGGPVAEATLKALGAIPVPLDLESGNANIDPNTIDGVETTYTRLSEVLGSNNEYTKYISETDHSVFLTAILANDSFFDSLSPKDQQALEKAALAAAQAERQDSITLGSTTRTQLQTEGSVITTLAPAEQSAFKTAVQPVYAQFAPMFGQQLMSEYSSI